MMFSVQKHQQQDPQKTDPGGLASFVSCLFPEPVSPIFSEILWASQYPLELLLWVSFCHLWIWTITIIVCNNANVKVHIFMVPNSLKLLSNHYFICTWKLKRLMGFSVCFVCLFVFNLVISFCLIYEVGGIDFEGKFCVKFFYNTLKSQSQKWI